MLRSKILWPAIAAGLLHMASPASAQEACLATFDDYADPTASIACSCSDAAPSGVIYGTLIYTSDSDICTAAAHAGQVTTDGMVKLRGAPGCSSYEASTRNGVASNSWSSWDVSYYFPGTHDGSCASQASNQPQPQPQPQPPAGGDALSMILAMAQSAPPGVFSYQQANSLGPTSFELLGVAITPEGPGSTVPIQRIYVENIDMIGMMSGAPSVLNMRIEGLMLTSANSDLDSDFWEFVGTQSLGTNLVLNIAMDQATKAFTLHDFTIEFPGIGKATLGLDLLGVGSEALMAPEMAMFSASLKSASLTLQDETFFSRGLTAAMRESGMTEQQLLEVMLQELSNSLAEMGAQPGDAVYDAAGKLAGLVIDAHSPKGPLTVSLNPAQPVSFAQMNQLSGPAEAAALVNLQVSYGGSVATLPEAVAGGGSVSDPYVYTDKDVYAAGEPVAVYWSGLPGNAQDWITVVAASAPDDDWGQWTYTNGATDGYYEVTGLAAGDYEVRVYYDWPDGGFVVQSSYYFVVQ